MSTIWIVLPILTLLMFELGLTLKSSDFKIFLTQPRPVLVGLIGQLLLLPAIAWLIAWAFKLPPHFFIGFVLIACCPGGSSSNVFSMLAKGDVALSVSLTALSSLITLLTVPLIMSLATSYAGSSVNIHLPVGRLFVQNIVLMFVPIVAGIIVGRRYPRTASRIDNVLRRIAFPSIILLAGIFFVQNKAAIIDNFTLLGLSVTALILAAAGGAWLMARIAKLQGRQRRTIVIEVGMQNAAQAIAIASSPFVFNNDIIAVPAIIYALMMNIVLIAYVAIVGRKKTAA